MGASPRHDGVDLGQTRVVRGARRLAIICSRGNTDESFVKTLQKEAAADRFRRKRWPIVKAAGIGVQAQ
jgi:hypothetical protein